MNYVLGHPRTQLHTFPSIICRSPNIARLTFNYLHILLSGIVLASSFPEVANSDIA